MKTHKIPQWFSLLLVMAGIAACTQSIENATKPSPKTTVSFAATVTPSTETMLPTLTHTTTDTPTPSPTLTAVPTLPTEDAQKKWFELLATNGGCRLPCLWGITPGKSSYQEARNILSPLSSVAETYSDPFTLNGVSMGSATPLYVEGDLHLNNRVAYWYDDNGLVNYIVFQVLEEKVPIDVNGDWISKTPILDSSAFGKRVEYYSLAHVLSEQGIPDSVMIYIPRVEGRPIVAGVLETVLLYPEQGIWIKYTMSMSMNDTIIKGCPANAHIEMQLYPSGNPEAFFSGLEKTDWERIKGGFKPLEEATSISVEQFYETFQNTTDKCIETPTNLWPT